MQLKSSNLWIIFLLTIKYCAAEIHKDCETPPTVTHATFRLMDDSGDDETRAIYKCDDGYELVGNNEIYCDLDTDEWQDEPPICNAKQPTNSGESSETARRKKKGRGQEVQEEKNISEEYASQLDVSCIGAELIKAPAIDNAYIVKYNRRKKGDHTFLVAFYECEEDFDLENHEQDRLYCSKQKWIGQNPQCISVKDEDEDDYNDEDNYDDENGDNGDNGVHTESEPEENNGGGAIPDTGNENGDEEGDEEYTEKEEYSEDENYDNYSEDYDGEHPSPVGGTNGRNKTTTERTQPEITDTEVSTCGKDNGGCDHDCKMVHVDNEIQPRIICSCYSGFQLDELDRRSCTDIDECHINNGGCEQTCTNKPGTFECSCEKGLQIDTTNGKTCVDINECLLRNGHGPCQDTCINTYGSYTCTCDGLPGTILQGDHHSCNDSGECENKNGGCSHTCLTTMGRIYCLCPDGYVLGDDWKTCTDINECHNPDVIQLCKNGCENTIGSYRCMEQTEHHQTTHVVQQKHCSAGFMLSQHGECEDVDECSAGTSGCEHCQNEYGGFQCVCPSGYELNDDEKTCSDIDECQSQDYESGETPQTLCTHQCINLVGSYKCACPDDLHLHSDRRTCVQDTCGDLTNPELNKTICNHSCVDEENGYRCTCPVGHRLADDKKTCITDEALHSGTDHCTDNHDCHPGKCINEEHGFICECPNGFQSIDQRCRDIDECQLNMHGCSHDCHNVAGSYECACPHGYQLGQYDGKTCEDIDECAHSSTNDCGDLECINESGTFSCVCPVGSHFDKHDGVCKTTQDLCYEDNGGCSHFCATKENHVICSCPDSFKLNDDHKTCYAVHDCHVNNGGCSHYCSEEACVCPEGYKLREDGKTCIDHNECVHENGGCQHECINHESSYECRCHHGYELSHNEHTCLDINECEQNNGECEHNCHNTNGSYECRCREGFTLDDNRHSCVDIDECAINNGDCSHTCHNLNGGHQCACPEGQVLVDDERRCDYVNECQINNGGCSHDCDYDQGRVICLCPHGYELHPEDDRTCVDINECDDNNGGCSHQCHNSHGHYKCFCPSGFILREDHKTCLDIDECSESNGNCSDICINLLGSYSCACEAGFELQADNHTCNDIDECAEDLHDCSHYCHNRHGSFECQCPHGYTLGEDKFTCEDVNECHTIDYNGGCSDGCINTLGSFFCTCPDGHVLTADNRTCSDVDECSDELKMCSHDCVNTIGAFKCLCPPGLELGDDLVTCTDINECSLDGRNGGCTHTCENFEGSYRCRCPNGFHLHTDMQTCVDYDECENSNGGCEQLCENYEGGFRCLCNPGFHLKADHSGCQSSDPCVYRNGGCQHICTVVGDRAVCTCERGFEVNPSNRSSCLDIDECQIPNQCQHKCYNLPGAFKCDCNPGFTKDSNGYCIDVDECKYNNGGCSMNAKCINIIGGFKCLCPEGFKTSRDQKQCHAIKDHCKSIEAPAYGEMRCTRSRHKTQLYYRTKCAISCKKGFKLDGPSVRNCNGTGHWDEEAPICVPLSCPHLARPEHGTILPAACVTGKTFAGERCHLHCSSGFKPAGKRVAVCGLNRNWEPNPHLECIPIETETAIKPFIKCPADTTITLSRNQKLVYVQLEQPKTNVDWHKYVDSHPSWGKDLEANLPIGIHIITFRARSPNSNLNDICRTVITVKTQQPPEVVFCPESFEVTLEPHEVGRALYWKEPKFRAQTPLKQIYKSKLPGQKFSPGEYYVSYVATDRDGMTSNCNFKISVKTGVENVVERTHADHHENNADDGLLLSNHESYLLCPGKNAIRVPPNYPFVCYLTPKRAFPAFYHMQLHVPRGCHIKNINRSNKPHGHLKHHYANKGLKHYQSYGRNA